MTTLNCDYPSALPVQATFIYAGLSFIIFIIVLIIAIKKKENIIKKDNKVKLSFKKKTMKLFKKLKSSFGIYGALTAHIFDQASDVAVIIQFGLLTYNDIDCNNIITNKPIKMYQYFYTSITAFIFYRIITSIWIYYICNDWIRILFQLFDAEIFRSIYITYKYNITKKIPPQKIITVFESILEAMPQLLIQTSFIGQTGKTDDYILIFSITWSIFVILVKLADEDEVIFKDAGDGSGDTIDYQCNYDSFGNNIQFVLRILFRWFNITSILLLYSLIYSLGYGYITISMIGISIILTGIGVVIQKELSIHAL